MNESVKIEMLYGLKCIRPDWSCRPGAIIEYRPPHIPHIIPARIAPRCDFCGHPPGDGRHKCLNCGAPK